jgi:outer membrane immunogenic protein
MKTFFAAATIAALGVSSALAADLPARTYTKAPPIMAPAYNWTGFYLGINGGGAWGRRDAAVDFTTGNFDLGPAFGRATRSSGVVGVHAGYNFQVAPSWLIGLEGDWDWTNLRRTSAAPLTFGGVPFGVANVQLNDRTEWLASLRGRLGYVAGDWLLYGTGGVAFAHNRYDGFVQINVPGVQNPYSFERTTTGWVAGAGVEWKLAANWLLRAEYLHYGFKGETFGFTSTGFFGTAFISHGRNDIDVVRGGISYKF